MNWHTRAVSSPGNPSGLPTARDKLQEIEVRFRSAARAMVVFTCVSDTDRQYASGRMPNEVVYHLQSPPASLCRYQASRHSPDHVEMLSILKRAAVMTSRLLRQEKAARPGPIWSSYDLALINSIFPLRKEFYAYIHHLDFTIPRSDSAVITSYQSTRVRMGNASVQHSLARSCETPIDQSIQLTWFHAPANHQLWMTWMADNAIETNTKRKNTSLTTSSFHNVWSDHARLTRSLPPSSRHLKPLCASMSSGSPAREGFRDVLLIMPYLHWDTKMQAWRRRKASKFCEMSTLPKEVREAHEKANNPQDTRYRNASILTSSPLCPVLVLEDFRCPTSFTEDQKWDGSSECTYSKSETNTETELVVHHLWMLTVGPNTIVTNFPRKDVEYESLELARIADLEDAILDEVKKISHPAQVLVGAIDMCALILRLAATNLLLSSEIPSLSFLDMYRHKVAAMRRRNLASLAAFRSQLLKDAREGHNTDWDDLALVLDSASLKDELHALEDITKTQIDVAQQFLKIIVDVKGSAEIDSSGQNHLENALQTLQCLQAEFADLRSNIHKTEQDILQLLDLKQKHASFQEARAAVVQAESSAMQTQYSLLLTRRSAAQGQIVMIFTLLTAIYLPLSFFTSYYGMNLRSITGDDGNPYSQKDFWKISGPVSAATVLAASLACTIFYGRVRTI